MVLKTISKEEYNAQTSLITEEIESDLTVLGATGIEDKLQE